MSDYCPFKAAVSVRAVQLALNPGSRSNEFVEAGRVVREIEWRFRLQIQ